MRRMGLNRWLVVSVVLLAAGGTAAGRIIHVDDDANVGGDGQTWGTAYKYLQDGLSAAGGGDEIWVAEGRYKPDEGVGISTGDRKATFKVIRVPWTRGLRASHLSSKRKSIVVFGYAYSRPRASGSGAR